MRWLKSHLKHISRDDKGFITKHEKTSRRLHVHCRAERAGFSFLVCFSEIRPIFSQYGNKQRIFKYTAA